MSPSLPVAGASPTTATLILGIALLVVIVALAGIARGLPEGQNDRAKSILALAAVLAGVFGGGALGTIFAKTAADQSATNVATQAAQQAANSVANQQTGTQGQTGK